MSIGGFFHYQVNDSFIYIPNNNLTYHQSLVDRGDNGVFSGEYVTFIKKYPFFHVNIWSI